MILRVGRNEPTGYRRPVYQALVVLVIMILTASCATGASSSPGAPSSPSAATGASPSEAAAASPSTGEETTLQRILRQKAITFAFLNEVPYGYAETGSVTGQDPETLKAIMGKLGVETFDGVVVDTAGMIPGLLAKRFDVLSFGMTITPERCQQVNFSNPVLASTQGLGVARGNPKNLHSYKDIAADPSVKVGMDRGASQLPTLKLAGVKDDQILQYTTTDQTMSALETGRVDAIAVLGVLLQTRLDRQGNSPKFELAKPFETPVDASGKPIEQFTGDAFRKEDTDLLEAFNKGLAELHASGQMKEIIRKFGFPEDAVPPPDKTSAEICAG